MDPREVPNWLELSVVTTERGAAIEVSLYRWVKVLESGEEVLAKVWWDSRFSFGGVSKKSVKDDLDILLTSFAADYYRSKR